MRGEREKGGRGGEGRGGEGEGEGEGRGERGEGERERPCDCPPHQLCLKNHEEQSCPWCDPAYVQQRNNILLLNQ